MTVPWTVMDCHFMVWNLCCVNTMRSFKTIFSWYFQINNRFKSLLSDDDIYHSLALFIMSWWMWPFFSVINYGLFNIAKDSCCILCLHPSDMNKEKVIYMEPKVLFEKQWKEKRHRTNRRRSKYFFSLFSCFLKIYH